MKQFCGFLKSFFHITWTTTTISICALPFIILLAILHLIVIARTESRGVVLSYSPLCSSIGGRILQNGGSVVDAAIATMICEGVVLPRVVGIGGGFVGIMFVQSTVKALIATPTVPANMPYYLMKSPEKLVGAQASGIPGALLGYWEMHQKYGLLPWKELFKDSIRLCREGIDIDVHTHDLLQSGHVVFQTYLKVGLPEKQYRALDYHRNESRQAMKKRPALGRTLEKVANFGISIFYNGEVGEAFIKEMQALDGGVMTMDDLRNYRVSWSQRPVSFSISKKLKAFTTPLPTSGAIVALVINVIRPIKDKENLNFWHQIVEATKHAIGLGSGLSDAENEPSKANATFIQDLQNKMIDMDFARSLRNLILKDKTFNDSDYYNAKFRPKSITASASICVISSEGEAVVMTSSLISHKKSFKSKSTGIVLNNELRSFGSFKQFSKFPEAPGSEMRPGKRAQSPSCPVIVLNKRSNQVYFTVGSAGGQYISSQVITALIKYCMLRYNSFRAINTGFLHAQPFQNYVEFEDSVPVEILDYLHSIGHSLKLLKQTLAYCITTCIGNSNLKLDPQISQGIPGIAIMVDPTKNLQMLLLCVIVLMCFIILLILVFDYIKQEKQMRI